MKWKALGKRFCGLLMAGTMILSMTPQSSLSVLAEEEQTEETTQQSEVSPERKVLYLPNGGEGSMDEQTVQDGTFSVSDCAFTREGYDFAGWSTTPDNQDVMDQGDIIRRAVLVPAGSWIQSYQFEGEESADLEVLFEEDQLRLYAQWTEHYVEPEPETPEVDITSDDLQTLTEAPEITREAMMQLRNQEPVVLLDESNAPANVPENTWEGDGTSIENIQVSWIDAGDAASDRTMDLTDGSNAPFEVRMRVDLQLSGQNNYAEGDIQIRIPKTMLKDRNDNPMGVMSLSVPEDPDKRATFAFTDMGEYYLLTNTRSLPANTVAYFEFTLRNHTPSSIVSNKTSEVFKPAVSVRTQNGNTLTREPDQGLTLKVLTKEELRSAVKYSSAVYMNWPPEWSSYNVEGIIDGEKGNYIYIDWYAYANIKGNQPYTISLKEVPGNITGPDGKTIENPEGVKILGYRYNNQMHQMEAGEKYVLADNDYQRDGSRYYTHIYAAYPKELFKAEGEEVTDYKVSNSITYELTDVDDNHNSSKSGSGTADVAIVPFYVPNGQFNTWKTGYGGDRYTSYRAPDSYSSRKDYYGYALNTLSAGSSVNLKYQVIMQAFGYSQTLGENGEYGQKSYGYRITDKDLYWDDELNVENYRIDPEKRLLEENYVFESLQLQTPTVYEYVKYDQSGSGYRRDKDGTISYGIIRAGEYGFRAKSNGIIDLKITAFMADGTQSEASVSCAGSTIALKNTGSNFKLSAQTLALPENTVGYVVEAITKEAGFDWRIVPTVQLKATDYIKQYVEEEMARVDNPSIPLSNVVSTEVLNDVGDVILSENVSGDGSNLVTSYIGRKKGSDLLQGSSLAVNASKKIVGNYESDNGTQMVRIPYELSVDLQSNITNLDSYNTAIQEGYITRETSGTFYDLLPAHSTVDLDSIKLRTGDQITYVGTEDNFRGSGRTMLIVKADLTPQPFYNGSANFTGIPGYADELKLTYDVWMSYENIRDFGTSVENNFVYESDNEKLGNLKNYMGEPDDPTAGNHRNSKGNAGSWAAVLTNLDPARDDPSFVYGRLQHKVNVDMYEVSSTSKTVSVNGGARFSTGTAEGDDLKAYAGGLYTYRIRKQNQPDSTATDLIYYDLLDAYVPSADGNQEEAKHHDEYSSYYSWKGTLLSVDTSEAEARGIKPVVYVSTKENLTFSRDSLPSIDGNNETWQVLNENTDLSKVTAVAVDLRKTTDGEPFMLAGDQALNVYINMKAPDAKAVNENHYTYFKDGAGTHAYNEAYVTGKFKDKDSSAEVPQTQKTPYTRVALIPLTIDVEKTWSDEDNQDGYRPSEVKVELLADNRGTGKTVTLNHDNKWQASFGTVDPINDNGKPIYYSFKETANDGDISQYRQSWTVSSAADDKGYETRKYNLTNTHIPEVTTISGQKTWDDVQAPASSRPSSIKITLYADGVRKAQRTVSAADNWRYSFANMPVKKQGKEITYTVAEDEYYEGYYPEVDGFNITNHYDPYGSLEISKVLKDATPQAQMQEFTFTASFFTEQDEEKRQALSGTYLAVKTATDGTSEELTISSGDSFTLRADQTLTIEGLPITTWYELEEQDKEGFTLTGETRTSGMIRSHHANKAVFENTYQASGDVQLSAKKQLSQGVIPDRTFIFQVKDEKGEVIRRGSNQGETVTFGRIRYSLADLGDDGKATKTYTITEQENENLSWYSFSKAEFKATVTLEDAGNGQINTSVVYTKLKDDKGNPVNEEVDVPVFVNEYHASGNLEIKVWKKLVGRELKENEFEFELRKYKDNDLVTEGDSEVLLTAKNAADGSVIFKTGENETNSPLVFAEQDLNHTFKFEISEKEGTDSTVKYSKEKLIYLVEPHDNGTGQISFDMKLEGENTQPVIQNQLQDGSLAITKSVGNASTDQEFNFRVDLKYPADAEVNEEQIKAYTKEPVPGGEDKPEGLVERQEMQVSSEDAAATNHVEETQSVQAESKTPAILEKEEKLTQTVVQNNDSAPVKATTVQEKARSAESIEQERQDFYNSLDKSGVAYAEFDKTTGTLWFKRAETLPEAAEDDTYIVWSVDIENGIGTNNNIPWSSIKSQVKSVQVEKGKLIQPKHMNSWFSACSSLTDLDLTNLDTSNVTNFDSLFARCVKLTDLSSLRLWNTSNVVTMVYMFQGSLNENRGSDLQTLHGLENWNVSNVLSFDYIFNYCNKLNDISAVKDWKTDKAINLFHAFDNCSSLQSLEALQNWNTSRVTDLSYAFYQCSSLASLNGLAKWDTSSVTNLSYAFYRCSSLTSLDGLANWNTSKLENLKDTFYGCYRLTSLDGLAEWNTSQVTTLQETFYGCSQITSLDGLTKWNTSQVTTLSKTFRNCTSIASLKGLMNWDTSKVTTLFDTFAQCYAFKSLEGLKNWKVDKVTSMSGTFSQCSNLEDIRALKTWFSSPNNQLKDLSNTFSNCRALQDVTPLATWNISKVTTLYAMFYYCSGLIVIDFSKWNTSSVTMFNSMFAYCSSLQDVSSLGNWDVKKCNNFGSMFRNTAIQHLDLSRWEPSINCSTVTSSQFKEFITNCNFLQSIDMTNWNTDKISDSKFLLNCGSVSSLQSITLGEKWRFNWGSKYELPIYLNNSSDSNYTGNWMKNDKTPFKIYGTNDEKLSISPQDSIKIREGANGAGTWVRELKPTKYEISFDANGGSGSMASIYGDINETVTIPDCGFTYPGYDFAGWLGSNGKRYDNQGSIPAGDVEAGSRLTLSAQWNGSGSLEGEEGSFNLTLKGNERAVLTGIPAGTTYTVYEETPSGWKLVQSVGTSGTIEAQNQSKASFWNEKEEAEKIHAVIVAQKILEGGELANGQFQFVMKESDSQNSWTALNTATGAILFPVEFEAVEGDYTFNISEMDSSLSNIEYDSESKSVTVSVKKNAENKFVAKVSNVPVFTNKVKAPASGMLTVTKQIENLDQYSESRQSKLKNQSFTVQVTVDGVATTYTLKHGQPEPISIPVGSFYQVEEADIPSDYELVSIVSESGFMTETGAQSVVTNRYTGTIPSVSVMLEASKILNDGVLEDGQFSFELRDIDNSLLQTKTNSADGKILFDELKFESPGTYTYKVAEVGSDSAVVYDSTVRTVKVVVTETESGNLASAVTWSAEGKETPSVFVNEMKPGMLKISKTVKDGTAAAKAQSFTFHLKISNVDGKPLESISLKDETESLKPDADGLFSIKMTDGQSRILILPNGSHYEISEEESAGFTCESHNETGTIVSDQTTETVFTNTYAASGVYTPTAAKVLTGKQVQAGQFTFLLGDENGKELEKVKNDEHGKIQFSDISYSLKDLDPETGKGTFTYYMQEVDEGADSIIYDQAEVKIVVTVEDKDGNGTLTVTPKFFVGEEPLSGEIIFTNHATVLLPSAGQSGMKFGLLAGALILAICIWYALIENKKKPS